MLLLLGAKLLLKTFTTLHWHYQNSKLQARAQKIIDEKANTKHEFKHYEKDFVEVILSMDVAQLRQGLFKGEFSSEDLVHIFAQRCYTIGRRLCLTTEECFDEAI